MAGITDRAYSAACGRLAGQLSVSLAAARRKVDIRAAREPGQAYVAVSRVRSLAGLNFKEWFKGVHVSPEAIEFYRKINN